VLPDTAQSFQAEPNTFVSNESGPLPGRRRSQFGLVPKSR
jgi:hypothetical protein